MGLNYTAEQWVQVKKDRFPLKVYQYCVFEREQLCAMLEVCKKQMQDAIEESKAHGINYKPYEVFITPADKPDVVVLCLRAEQIKEAEQ